MSFDIQKLTGTWKAVKMSDNLPQILQKFGDPDENIKKMSTAQAAVETTVSGNTVTVKTTVMGKTSENTFTLGVECDERGVLGTWQGKATYTIDGDALVSVHSDIDGAGGVVKRTRKFIDDKTLRTDYEVGGLNGWYEAQKV